MNQLCRGMRTSWLCALVLVGLLTVGMLPVARAPNNQTWDVIYNVDNAHPESATPSWTRFNSGTPIRRLLYSGTVLEEELYNGDVDQYSRTISDADKSNFFVMESRMFIVYNSSHSTSWVLLDGDVDPEGYMFQMFITPPDYINLCVGLGGIHCTGYYVENFTDANHTFRIVVYHGGDGDTSMDAYIDGYYVGTKTDTFAEWQVNMPIWRMTSSLAENLTVRTDYVLYRYENVADNLRDSIDSLRNRIDELSKELKDLKDRLSDMPDFPEVVPTGDIPFVPMHKPRFLDPGDRTCWFQSLIGIEYEVHDNGTGNDIALYSLYDVDDYNLDYARAVSSELFIAGTYTHLYINDTKSTATTSDDSVILDTTETISYYDLRYAYNISIQTDSGSSIKANRVSTMQIVYCRDWSETNGVYRLTYGIDNDSPQDWLRPVVVFTFPDVLVNTHSIEIYDHRNRLELKVGDHFSLMSTEAYLQVLYLNRSDSRGFDIQFTEDSDSDVLVFTITDKDIGFTGDGQYYFRIEHRQETTAQFHGKARIEFNCSKEYANKIPSNAGASVYVNRIGTDWFVFYEDELELMVYDVLFESNSLNTIEAYFDFKDQGFSLMDPEASVVMLILLAIFTLVLGIRWIHKSQGIRISDGKLVIRYKADFVLGIGLVVMGITIVWFLLSGLQYVLGYG